LLAEGAKMDAAKLTVRVMNEVLKMALTPVMSGCTGSVPKVSPTGSASERQHR
jgi:hypothetical protein